MAAVQLVATLKQEPPDLSTPTPTPNPSLGPSSDHLALEKRILMLCAEHPKGITDEILMTDQPHVPAELRMKALQQLLSQVLGSLLM